MSTYAVTHLNDIPELDDGRRPDAPGAPPPRHHRVRRQRLDRARTPATGSSTSSEDADERTSDPSAEELYIVQSWAAGFELDGERSTPRRARSSTSHEHKADGVRRGGGHDDRRGGRLPGPALRPVRLGGLACRGSTSTTSPATTRSASATVAAKPAIWARPLLRRRSSSIWPAARASPAARTTRSNTSDARSRCRIASARWRSRDSDFDPIRSEPAFEELTGS